MRAKFTVYSETRHQFGTVNYVLSPVVSGSPENESFFRTTPSGSITVTIKPSETDASLELGADYYVDFTRA